MSEKMYKKALEISEKHYTVKDLTSIKTMKSIAMMLLKKSEGVDAEEKHIMNKDDLESVVKLLIKGRKKVLFDVLC